MRNTERKGHRPILIVCATRDRPDLFYRAVKSCLSTSTQCDMAAYVDSDQLHLYLHARDWAAEFGDRLMLHVDRQIGPNASINVLYAKHAKDYRIFGVTPDDSQFMKTGWDDWVIDEFEKFPGRIGVVSPAHSDGNYCAYPYVSKEWLDIIGWYAMPEAHSFVWDTCIEMLGEATYITYGDGERHYMLHDMCKSKNFEAKLTIDEHAFLAWCVVSRRALVRQLRAGIETALRAKDPSRGGR